MKRKIIINPVKLCAFERDHYFKNIDEQAINELKHPHKKKAKFPAV